jgi:hypothetical protein
MNILKQNQTHLLIGAVVAFAIAIAIGGPHLAQGILTAFFAVLCVLAGLGVGKATANFGYGLIGFVASAIVMFAFYSFGWLDWLYELFYTLGEISQALSGLGLCLGIFILAIYGLTRLKWGRLTNAISKQ